MKKQRLKKIGSTCKKDRMCSDGLGEIILSLMVYLLQQLANDLSAVDEVNRGNSEEIFRPPVVPSRRGDHCDKYRQETDMPLHFCVHLRGPCAKFSC